MKRALKAIVGLVILVALVLVVLRVTGFNPHGPTPGLWLSGNLVAAPVTDWSFADRYPTIEVQTNTGYLIPHSVTIWCASYQGRLYLQAIGKMWSRNVARDPRVRIKIGDQLYDRVVAYVSDPGEFFRVEESMGRKYARLETVEGVPAEHISSRKRQLSARRGVVAAVEPREPLQR